MAGEDARPTNWIFMETCKFCDSSLNNFDAKCTTCGFNANEESFNADIAQLYYGKLMKENWKKGIRFLSEMNDYLIQKKGAASTNPFKGGWSRTKTAKFLGKSLSGISQQINLAKELQNYPELENSRTANIAIDRLKNIRKGGITSWVQLEIDLQNFIVKNWNKWFNEWDLLRNDGKYDTKEIGTIDFLAKHAVENNRFLVIELKKDQSSDDTIGQILRYMGWVKQKLAGEVGEVEGIIISQSEDQYINYSLEYTKNITIKYWRIMNDKLIILSHEEDLKEKLRKLSPDQLNRFIKNYNNKES